MSAFISEIRLERRPMFAFLLFAMGCLSPQPAGAALQKQIVATGLAGPLFVTFAPGDSTRIYVLERVGRIRVVRNDTLVTRPVLDIAGIVLSTASEQGLLGLAFDPSFATNRRFFVNYTQRTDGRTVVAKFAAGTFSKSRSSPPITTAA
jgi:hypothetical protein